MMWVSPRLYLHIAQRKILLPSKSLSCLTRTLALARWQKARFIWSLIIERLMRSSLKMQRSLTNHALFLRVSTTLPSSIWMIIPASTAVSHPFFQKRSGKQPIIYRSHRAERCPPVVKRRESLCVERWRVNFIDALFVNQQSNGCLRFNFWCQVRDAPKTFGAHLGRRDLGSSSSLLLWKLWQNILIKSDK